jgi:hypothetical protein
MDNQELETQEVSTELVMQENIAETSLPITRIELGNNTEDVASRMLGLKSQALDVATRSWTPEKQGEKKMMMFLGGGYSNVPSMNEQGVTISLPYVEFLEAYKDGETNSLRKWRMTPTRIVTMFLQLEGSKEEGYTNLKYKYPTQTVFEIEYLGTVPSKKNPNHKIMDFAIRVPLAAK